jgi:hypothetical protein
MAISRIRWRLHISKKIEDAKTGITCAEEETDEHDEADNGTSQDENKAPNCVPAPGARKFFYPQKLLEGVEKGYVVSDVITSNSGHFLGHHDKTCFRRFHSDLVQFVEVLRSAYIKSTSQNLPIPDSWPPASIPVSRLHLSQLGS